MTIINKVIKTQNGSFSFPTTDKMPKGWHQLTGATTAPNGYAWICNGASLFSGNRKSCIIKTELI